MMIGAYDKTYLEDAMASLGSMLDYAVNTCGQDLTQFYVRFLASGVAREIYSSNPKYIAGMSGIELAMCVAARTGDPLPEKEYFVDTGSPEYWTGWTLAYLSWYLNTDFRTMNARGLTAEAVHDRYYTLHEADLSKAVRFAVKKLGDSNDGQNILKLMRNNAGLTQKDLSEKSGNSLRVIRAYEQGQRSLSNAAVESVRSISQVLGCRIEDLLP